MGKTMTAVSNAHTRKYDTEAQASRQGDHAGIIKQSVVELDAKWHRLRQSIADLGEDVTELSRKLKYSGIPHGRGTRQLLIVAEEELEHDLAILRSVYQKRFNLELTKIGERNGQ